MRKFLAGIGLAAAVGVFGLLLAITSDVGAAPNNSVPVAPALPGSVSAAAVAATIATPWNCAAGDMAGQLCVVQSDIVLTVGFQNPNNGRQIAQTYTIKLSSDGSTVTATNITGGANNVIAWSQPVNAAAKHANMIDFLNTCVVKLKNASAFNIQPSL